MTLNEIVANYADMVGRSHDHSFKEQMKFVFIYYRSAFLVRDLERNLRVPTVYLQDLGCVELEMSSISECCDVESDCTVMKTKLAIPTPVPIKSVAEFSYVGGITQNRPYKEVDIAELPYFLASKYTGKLPMYYYHPNGKVYTFNHSGKLLNIKGIFEDPRIAKDFAKCSGGACYNDDMPFPITGKMVQMITRGLMEGELRTDVKDDERATIQETPES